MRVHLRERFDHAAEVEHVRPDELLDDDDEPSNTQIYIDPPLAAIKAAWNKRVELK